MKRTIYERNALRDTALAMQDYVATFHRVACTALDRGEMPIARVMQRKAAQAHENARGALEDLLS